MDIAPLNMSPLFASGELLAMTCFDRFVVEALFTPQIVPLIKLFLFGDDDGNHLYQMECPEKYVNSLYRVALTDMLSDGKALFGLLRSPEMGSHSGLIKSTSFSQGDLDFSDNPSLPDASLPYVMTNPDPDSVILRNTDLLFVLGKRDAMTPRLPISTSRMVETSNKEEAIVPNGHQSFEL